MTSDEAPLRRGGGMKYASQALPRRRLLWPALALAGLMLLSCAEPPYKAHFNRAQKHMDAKNYPAAESDYREAIRLKPGYAEAHCYLGVALGKQGKTEEAEKEFREAIRCKPDDGKALKNLAIVLDKRGERKEARGYWERALKGEKRPEIAEWIKHRLAEPD